MKHSITVSGLYIYPVKSFAGIALQEADLDGMGLKYDRRWMVVSPEGLFLTQRKIPQMALVSTALDAEGNLTLSRPGQEDHVVKKVQSSNQTMQVRVWKDSLDVPLVGEQSDRWISEALGVACHLVFIPDDVVRQCDLEYAKAGDRTGFADGFPMLLVSEASLTDLNNRLAQPVEMRRFRPNIVVQGCGAFAEDSWQDFRLSDVVMKGVKRCSRCILTTVDPDTGERSGREPLETLSTFRKVDNNVFFGMNVIHQTMGKIRVGDNIVIEKV